MAISPDQDREARPPSLSARLVVWLCGLLLGAAITSYLLARVYTLNESMRVLSEDEVIWSGGSSPVPESISLWSRLSLVAVVICAVIYLVALFTYHLRKR